MRLGPLPDSTRPLTHDRILDHGLVSTRIPSMPTIQVPDQTTRSIRPLPRPFPRALFDDLTRSECLHFLEILHLALHADRTEQVRDLFVRFL